jgi:hypothetical protein
VGQFRERKGRIMRGYILREKEVEEEAKKARKAKNQGQWIRGRWERQACGGLKWIRPKFIPGQPLKEESYWSTDANPQGWIPICTLGVAHNP